MIFLDSCGGLSESGFAEFWDLRDCEYVGARLPLAGEGFVKLRWQCHLAQPITVGA